MENLTLLIPAKNEAFSLPLVLKEISLLKCKKLVIVDKNDYETINAIKNYDCIVHKQITSGYGNALIEGINKIDTEYLCIFNADGSFQPKDLSKMLELNSSGNDFVFASRYLKNGGSDDDTIITLVGNYIFSFLGKFFFGLNISDILYTYLMGKSSTFKELELKSNDFRICVEIPILLNFKKKSYISIPSHERSRLGGKKKVNAVKDGFYILLKMIQLYFVKILNVSK